MKNNIIKIKYADKEFYVVANVEYEGVKYLYIVENIYKDGMENIEDIKEEIHVETNFIYKLPNGQYQNIDDNVLFDKLLKLVHIDYIAGLNKFVDIDD